MKTRKMTLNIIDPDNEVKASTNYTVNVYEKVEKPFTLEVKENDSR